MSPGWQGQQGHAAARVEGTGGERKSGGVVALPEQRPQHRSQGP